MSATEDLFPNHGEESEQTELNGEETRCLIGLKSYYITFEERSEQEALEKAWEDLKREFPRLEPFKWYH